MIIDGYVELSFYNQSVPLQKIYKKEKKITTQILTAILKREEK